MTEMMMMLLMMISFCEKVPLQPWEKLRKSTTDNDDVAFVIKFPLHS